MGQHKVHTGLVGLFVLGSMVLSACGGGGASGGGDEPVRGESPAPAKAAKFAREGPLTSGDHFRVEVKALERQQDHTRLTMGITLKDGESGGMGWGHGPPNWKTHFSNFFLIDPVGKRHYATLREGDDGTGMAFGTREAELAVFKQGETLPVEIYFPSPPPTVRQMTLMMPGGLGEITGLPVTDAKPEATPEKPPEDWQVFPPEGKVWRGISSLQELVETPQKSKVQEGESETIGLRTDVLFAFDKARLSPKATSVLDDVVNETRERADPSKPPVIIEGHTDNKGDPSYNRRLSVRRAQAVQKYLATALGTDYQYKSTGKGETEPIADNEKDGKDNPEGRAKNRRVEISYKIKEQTPGATSSPGPSPGAGQGSVGPPAPFRPDPGPVVGTIEIKSAHDLRVDVHPFFRDGAYLVGVMEIVANSNFSSAFNPFDGTGTNQRFAHKASLGGFTAVDPATKARHYVVRVGGADSTWFLQGRLPDLEVGRSTRGIVYFPAPPADVTEMTLELQGFGKVDGVPIK